MKSLGSGYLVRPVAVLQDNVLCLQRPNFSQAVIQSYDIPFTPRNLKKTQSCRMSTYIFGILDVEKSGESEAKSLEKNNQHMIYEWNLGNSSSSTKVTTSANFAHNNCASYLFITDFLLPTIVENTNTHLKGNFLISGDCPFLLIWI